MKNPFDKCRVQEYETSNPIRKFKTINVFRRGEESLEILVAEVSPDKWAFGWFVSLESGEKVSQLPDLANGYATTEINAILFVAGELKRVQQRFSEDAKAAINDTIKKYRTTRLF